MTPETTQKFLNIGAYLDLEAAAQWIESLFSKDELQAGYPHQEHLREGRSAAELYEGLSNVFRDIAVTHFPNQDELNDWRKLYQDVAVVCKERGFDRLAAKIGVLNDLMELKCSQNLKDMGKFAHRPAVQNPDGTEHLKA